MSLSVVPPSEIAEPSEDLASRRGRCVTRRPGERHEPVALTAQQSTLLAEVGRATGAPKGTVLSILLQSATALDWAAAIGAPPLDTTRDLEVVERSAAYARYLTWLVVERHQRPAAEEDGPVTLPVRIIDSATPAAIDRALRQPPERAFELEIAAVRSGVTIGEWVARRVAERASGVR